MKERNMPSTKSKPVSQKAIETTVPRESTDPGSHLNMHHEHTTWLGDIENWRDDLVQWEGESRKLLTELKLLESMLQQHDLVLVGHSESLLAHRQNVIGHEHLLAKYEVAGNGTELIRAAAVHSQEREKHEKQLTTHEAIKHRHRMIVARWNELQKEISQLPTV